jgi:hypothetical protein
MHIVTLVLAHTNCMLHPSFSHTAGTNSKEKAKTAAGSKTSARDNSISLSDDDCMEVDPYTVGNLDTGGSSSSTAAKTKARTARAKQQQQQQQQAAAAAAAAASSSTAANTSGDNDDDVNHDSELDELLSIEIPGEHRASFNCCLAL